MVYSAQEPGFKLPPLVVQGLVPATMLTHHPVLQGTPARSFSLGFGASHLAVNVTFSQKLTPLAGFSELLLLTIKFTQQPLLPGHE